MKFKKISIFALTAIIIYSSVSFSQAISTYDIGFSRTYSYIDNLIEAGQFNKALEKTNELLKNNPQNLKARNRLATIYTSQFKLDEALKEYQSVLEYDSQNDEAHRGLGNIYYLKTTLSDTQINKNKFKYYSDALKEFSIAITINSENYKAYNDMGVVLKEMGKLDKAQSYFKQALELEPTYSKALENLGSIHFVKNNIDMAIEYYKEAIQINSKNSSAYYKLGEALIAQGKYNEAIKELNTSLYLFSSSATVHNMLGCAYELQGNETQALIEYKKSNLIKPEFTPAYINVANIYEKRGESELAITELKNALLINPDFKEGELKIADMLLNEGKTDKSINHYKNLIDDKTYSKLALQGLSKAYFIKSYITSGQNVPVSQKDYLEAHNALKQAISYNPNDMQLYLAMLRISKLANNDKDAEAYLKKILDNDYSNPVNNIIKGEALLAFKKYNQADLEFKKVLNAARTLEDNLYLGEILILNREYDSAKQAFEKVLIIDPNNQKALKGLERIQKNEQTAIAKYNIAKGLYEEGQKTQALELLKEAVELNPKLPRAQKLLGVSLDRFKFYNEAIEHYEAYINLIRTYDTDYKKYCAKINKLKKKIQKKKKSKK